MTYYVHAREFKTSTNEHSGVYLSPSAVDLRAHEPVAGLDYRHSVLAAECTHGEVVPGPHGGVGLAADDTAMGDNVAGVGNSYTSVLSCRFCLAWINSPPRQDCSSWKPCIRR